MKKQEIIIYKVYDKAKNFNLKKGENKIQFQYEITNPKRWWCNGLGEPPTCIYSNKYFQKEEKLLIAQNFISDCEQ